MTLRKVWTILSSATFWLVPVLGFGAPHDALWRKAVAISSANEGWVAGLVVTRSEVLRKGDTVGVHEIWQRSTLGEDGEVITRTAKILEDGKDVTQKEKEQTKEKREKKASHDALDPFNPKAQKDLTVTGTDQSKVIAERNCVAYEFDMKSKNGPRVKGIAWLDKEKGNPVEIENMTIDPLPEKHLTRLAITTRYESTPEGVWRVKEMITTGTVSVMFIKADTRMVTTFSEYWKQPGAATPADK